MEGNTDFIKYCISKASNRLHRNATFALLIFGSGKENWNHLDSTWFKINDLMNLSEKYFFSRHTSLGIREVNKIHKDMQTWKEKHLLTLVSCNHVQTKKQKTTNNPPSPQKNQFLYFSLFHPRERSPELNVNFLASEAFNSILLYKTYY